MLSWWLLAEHLVDSRGTQVFRGTPVFRGTQVEKPRLRLYYGLFKLKRVNSEYPLYRTRIVIFKRAQRKGWSDYFEERDLIA